MIQEAQAISHTAVGGTGKNIQAFFIKTKALGTDNGLQLAADLLGRQQSQIELQAPRKNRRRQFLGVSGGQQKLHMGRRLFQRLQKRIETMPRQHMHLVNEVNLVLPLGGRVLHVV